MLEEHSDSPLQLMILAKNGNHEAYGKVYQQFFTPVFRYLYQRLGDREVAEDLAQTVFLKIFESLHRFNDQNISPLAYFFTVARNTMLDFIKKKKEILLPEDESIEVETQASENPKFQMHEKEKQISLQRALRALPAEQHEAISLKFMQGLKNHEIATIMKKTETTIRQLQCRGLKKLRHAKSLEILLS